MMRYIIKAKELNEQFNTIQYGVHFRGSINSMTLISISYEKPMGGIKVTDLSPWDQNKFNFWLNELKRHIGSEIQLKDEELIDHAEIEAQIIRDSMNNNRVLPFGNDRVKFLTSEFAEENWGKIIIDILGLKSNQLVIIEIKAKRVSKPAIRQIEAYSKRFITEYEIFKELAAVYDCQNLSKEPIKMIVWPDREDAPLCRDFVKAGIIEITYKKGNGKYKFRTY